MNVSLTVVTLAGSVALLLWGVRMVQTGVQRAFGAKLRSTLGQGLENRGVEQRQPDRLGMKRMVFRNASIRSSTPLTRSSQTRRASFADVEAVERVETISFPRIAERDRVVRLRPVLAIARL